MMFQKGPGEGYGAAKGEALALNPKLRCHNVTHQMGEPYFVVLEGVCGRRVGEGGRNGREAWSSALAALQDASK